MDTKDGSQDLKLSQKQRDRHMSETVLSKLKIE